MIIISFREYNISNQSIVNQNYIENEDLLSTVDFLVQSAVSWGMSIALGMNRYKLIQFRMG